MRRKMELLVNYFTHLLSFQQATTKTGGLLVKGKKSQILSK